MATYMYTSTTGSNWDDDEDFEFSIYTAFSESSAPPPTKADLAEHHHLPVVHEQDESESEQCTSPTISESTIDYECDPEFWPTYAQKVTQSWYFPTSHPAFPELSHDGEFSYPTERVQYHANWTAAKLRVGANMRYPLMMKPSPLQLSETWVRDGCGEFVEDTGLLLPPVPMMALAYDSSDEERDEARTPPRSPPAILDMICEEDVEQYDPITGTKQNTEGTNIACDLVDFGSIAADLNVSDILGDAASNMQHVCITDAAPISVCEPSTANDSPSEATAKALFEPAQLCVGGTQCHIGVSKKGEPTRELVPMNVEATHITPPLSNSLLQNPSVNSDVIENNSSQNKVTSKNNNPIWSATSSSPDLKYIHDPTNTSLVWNTLATGWFAMSSVPWGRIAVGVTGALVELASLMVRC